MQDTSLVFATTDFAFADDEGMLKPGFPLLADANALAAVIIETVPANGMLILDGVTLTAGTSVAAALITAGKLVCVPAANANGSSLDSFTFRVRDDGGTNSGGSDTSAAYTMTIDVAAVTMRRATSSPAPM